MDYNTRQLALNELVIQPGKRQTKNRVQSVIMRANLAQRHSFYLPQNVALAFATLVMLPLQIATAQATAKRQGSGSRAHYSCPGRSS